MENAPAELVELIKEVAVEHRDFVDHEHSRDTPALGRVPVERGKQLVDRALGHADAGKRVERRAADDSGGDARCGRREDAVRAVLGL
jgi:hypothetical protein